SDVGVELRVQPFDAGGKGIDHLHGGHLAGAYSGGEIDRGEVAKVIGLQSHERLPGRGEQDHQAYNHALSRWAVGTWSRAPQGATDRHEHPVDEGPGAGPAASATPRGKVPGRPGERGPRGAGVRRGTPAP